MSSTARAATKAVHFPTMMFTGIGSSIILLAVFKFGIKPYLQEQRRRDNELLVDTLMGPLEVATPDGTTEFK